LLQTPVRKIKENAHYSWAIFSLAFTNLAVEGGIKNSAPVLFLALRDGFGRSAAATAAIFSVGGLTAALIAPLLGNLLDRLGPRYLFPVGGAFILLGFVLSSLVSDFWQLFICYGVLVTIGETIVSSFTATAVLAPWFPRSRGKVLGLADAGNPLGQGIFTPLSQILILAFGWRVALRTLGPIFFLMVAPANLLFQRRPPSQDEQITAVPVQTEEGSGGPSDIPDINTRQERFRAILKGAPLWCLVSARTLAALGHQMTIIHLVAFFVAAGYSHIEAASTIGVVGLLSLGGRPLTGALSDFVGRELIYTVGMGMQVAGILAVLLLGDGDSFLPLALFVGLTGLSDGIAGLAVGAKAADLFPSSNLGSVMGIVQSGRGVGIMAGPILGGFLYDKQGDYMMAFSLAVVIIMVAVAFMWGAGITGGKGKY
jgi:MFS family permease